METFDFKKYNDSIHKIGRICMSIALTMLLFAPFLLAKLTGGQIEYKAFFKAIIPILLIYIPSCIVEYLIYVPLLGSGASYLAFITGNITNLKLPCAFSAREIAKAEVGSKENEIISTLSIAASSLITMAVIFLGVVLLIPLTPILKNPVLQPAFSNILPALFGALSYQYFKKSLKITIVPLAFMIIISSLIPSLINSTSFLLIACGALAIGYSYILYKNNKL